MPRSRLFSKAGRIWSAVAIASVAGAVSVALAQAPADGAHHQAPAAPGVSAATSVPDQHQMMKAMAADNERLAALLVTMNMATGDQRVDAMVAVINELAAQRTRMQTQMMRMQTGMMDMKARMAAMHGPGGMMKEKAPEPAAGEPDHSAHHPEK